MNTHVKPPKGNPATESLRKEQREQRVAERKHGKDAALDEALEETFPASDPIAAQEPTKPGAKRR
ncbi:MAG: hypothetical protein DI527_14535 [Chelatococcus sp.]|nr:MAG: hypothetical protein DI527_14535 [Chelatococcus sp.]